MHHAEFWPEEFELHFRGALKNGRTLEDLKETLKQIAVYCGMPTGVAAFRIARKVLGEKQPT
jgi:4-carboxymuconolactone decarboxylase